MKSERLTAIVPIDTLQTLERRSPGSGVPALLHR